VEKHRRGKQIESTRSSAPPCPAIIAPQSFAPSERLTAESTSSPTKPASTIASDIRNAAPKLNVGGWRQPV
jgi:hypothetical protein